MAASPNKASNLMTAEHLVREAAASGAELVALPEYFSCYGESVSRASLDRLYGAAAEPIPGPTAELLAGLAKELSISILGESIFERSGELVHNSSMLFDSSGELVATYRKIHLFEARAAEFTYVEGDAVSPGREIVTAPLPSAQGRATVGLSVCYDVRFPELYRILTARGAEVLRVPSAFPQLTGRDHWELLLRARAVENQAYVIAPAQWGKMADGTRLNGRSMIVDPWGTVLATCPDRDSFTTVTIDLDALADIRRRYPNLANRRAELFEAAS